MTRIVVDASVIIKLYFQEDDSLVAEQRLAQAEELLAPELIWIEIANAIWKRRRRGEISDAAASGILMQAMRLPLHIHPSADLLDDALRLAIGHDRTVYDSLYLALAVGTRSVMVTADRRLVRSLAGTPLAKHVAWIGDPP